MKKLIVLFFLLFGVYYCRAQMAISGVVVDSLTNTPLAFATVQALDQGQLVAFDITNDKGEYEIKLDTLRAGVLKVSYIGYDAKEKRFAQGVEDGNLLQMNFKLKESSVVLKEVVIEAKGAEIIARNDTIVYNLDHYTNGTEETLGDVINKIPGLEVDENGKIKAGGKKIDHLLIDGEAFFDDQHQLATRNISSEMLEDIELLQKYKEFASIADLENSDKTALNINIKDEFKGKITGDLAVEYGYKKRYSGHSNLFSFTRKAKISLIADANNTGQEAMTFHDYISFRGGIRKFVKNMPENGISIIDDNDMPVFLMADNAVEDKNSAFAALNFVYSPLPDLKVNAHAILSQNSQKQAQHIRTDFYSGKGIDTAEEAMLGDGSFFFNTSVLNLDYKPDEKSILNYTTSFNPLKDSQNRDSDSRFSETRNMFEEEATNQSFTFGQQLSYLRRFNESTLLTLNAFQDIVRKQHAYHIYSNQSFLNLFFPENNYQVYQNRARGKTEYGNQVKLTKKVNQNTLIARAGVLLSKQYHNIALSHYEHPDATDKASIKRNDYLLGVSWAAKGKGIFHYTLKLEGHYFDTKYKPGLRAGNVFLFPAIDLDFKFKSTHVLGLKYNYSNSFPALEQFVSQEVIKDLRTIYSEGDVGYNSIIPMHNYSLSYFIIDLFSGTTASLNVSYSTKQNASSTNAGITDEVNAITYRIAPFDRAFNSFFLLDYKFSEIPFSARLNFTTNFANKINYLQGVENNFRTNLISAEFSTRSLFKSPVFNFATGLNFKLYQVHYVLADTKNSLRVIHPFLDINSKLKNGFSTFLNAHYDYYLTDRNNRNRLVISPGIKYHKNKSNWEFSLQGNDILNLNNTEEIETQYEINYVREKIIRSLPGYFSGKVKYKF